MDRFPLFARVSLLYFAAVSFAETARRLGRPHLATSYLLRNHLSFGPQMRALLHRARTVQNPEDAGVVAADILAAIEQIDVAGLRRNAHTNWFPIDAEDLLSSASKLEVSAAEITAMLERSGFLRSEDRCWLS
jgi:tetracycline 7-halogenase / FADH2 O2-dependent halogenase